MDKDMVTTAVTLPRPLMVARRRRSQGFTAASLLWSCAVLCFSSIHAESLPSTRPNSITEQESLPAESMATCPQLPILTKMGAPTSVPCAKLMVSNLREWAFRRLSEDLHEILEEEQLLQEGPLSPHLAKAGETISREFEKVEFRRRWEEIGRGIEFGADIVVTALLGWKTFLELVSTFAVRTLSPCRPYGPLDCASAWETMQSSARKGTHRVLKEVGVRVEGIRAMVRQRALRAHTAIIASLLDHSLIQRASSVSQGLAARDAISLLALLSPSVRWHCVSPSNSLLCGGGEGHDAELECGESGAEAECGAEWKGKAGVQNFLRGAKATMAEGGMRVEKEAAVVDPVKRCVVLEGVHSGSIRGTGNTFHALFTHTLCFDTKGRVASSRLLYAA
eukprot:CAMPEP_0177739788 /NCGR_PEP_ID=MMETSP0484_2-20121128/27215_1 /TAXON_ID=354590 /ORGANISM="Rhodomonas lens, Strain RHODO" /LENGTH=392 /DNA_ID=CAMNT_0019253879 /DNA_START=1 /DNA_END=1179 /DNA_ORIENTATION=-